MIRLLPGVMGNEASGGEESFEGGLLEHPHFTKPAEWEGRPVPEVLVSGNHMRASHHGGGQKPSVSPPSGVRISSVTR